MRIHFTGALAGALIAGAAGAADGIVLEGSLVEGGFERYVPPVTNPIFNETPLIRECPIFCVRGFRSMLREKGSMDHGKDNRRRDFGRAPEGLRAA